ncbi:MAG TPA: hypothetical protein VNU01_04125 [Egibacteraceae bacterium]|nr:hypothetical protein [Egibacteraceae bacterium]
MALAIALLAVGLPAAGHPGGSHGGSGGSGEHSHTDQPRHGLEEFGFHPLDNKGFNTDIFPWASGDGRVWAATGTWGTALEPGRDCPSETDNPSDPAHSGIWIIEATDPATPRLAAKLGTIPGAQNLDMKVVKVDAPDGPRDVLVHSLEPCGVEGLLHQVPGTPLVDYAHTIQREAKLHQTGFQLYDVTDPDNPVRLGTFNNGGLGTHNLYPFHQGDRAFVAAVYNEVDFVGLQNDRFIRGHVQIVEITDPAEPVLLSQWDLYDAAADGGPAEDALCKERGVDSAFCYNHDVWVSDDGTILYNAFWDAGLVLLDISDPANPRFIGQAQEHTQADDPEGWLNEEGNTHSMIPMELDGRHPSRSRRGAARCSRRSRTAPAPGSSRSARWTSAHRSPRRRAPAGTRPAARSR